MWIADFVLEIRLKGVCYSFILSTEYKDDGMVGNDRFDSLKNHFFFIPSLGYGFHPALLLLVWWGSICLPSGSHNTERMLKRHQKFFSGCKTALKLSSTYHVPFLYASKNSHLMEKSTRKVIVQYNVQPVIEIRGICVVSVWELSDFTAIY